MNHSLAFQLERSDFNRIARLLKDQAGISLHEHKHAMVRSRLSKRLRKLGLDSFKEYCDLLADRNTPELQLFINALTTNLTAFFREDHHFRLLKSEIMPNLLEHQRIGRQPVRIWSAGCSSGEEPYSIAIALAEFFGETDNWNVEIMASDLDTQMLDTAERGAYHLDRVQGIGEERLRRWFLKGKGANQGMVRVIPELRERIKFFQLNLNEPWPQMGNINLIFCRNVLIYFDPEYRKTMFKQFARLQKRNDYFIIGHSETLNKYSDAYKMIHTTAYRRV